MKKIKIIITIATILCIGILVLFTFTGGKCYDVALKKYKVNETSINIEVMKTSSYGYLRSIGIVESHDDTKVYVNFNSTFGINNSLSAQNVFDISYPEDCKEIYFETGENQHQLIFYRKSIKDDWQLAPGIKVLDEDE